MNEEPDTGLFADPQPGSVGLADRVGGAFLGFWGAVISVLFAPMILWWNLTSDEFRLLFGRIGFNYFLMLWAMWLMVVGLVGGFLAGFWRTLRFLSHLWFTAEEPDRRLSLLLWAILCGIGAATYFILMMTPGHR
ncbi:MAG: hypothetical protein HY255_08195 [Betaproteobacteria bacterium]|nr:hypothetical protein [Betaproteobacteria bacterium]